ncbi:MAG: hypothetical protein WBP93_17720 [Pyrinomonadaceae bacterium]
MSPSQVNREPQNVAKLSARFRKKYFPERDSFDLQFPRYRLESLSAAGRELKLFIQMSAIGGRASEARATVDEGMARARLEAWVRPLRRASVIFRSNSNDLILDYRPDFA